MVPGACFPKLCIFRAECKSVFIGTTELAFVVILQNIIFLSFVSGSLKSEIVFAGKGIGGVSICYSPT